MSEHQFLDEQRELYNAQAQQVDTWQQAHDEAMQCREIEDAIQLGLMILANIRRHNDRWAKDLESSPGAFSWEDAESFARLFRWWREKSESLLGGIKSREASGFAVDGAAHFRQACREVDLMSLDVDQVRASIESLQSGSGMSLTQAMNGLRNSHQR